MLLIFIKANKFNKSMTLQAISRDLQFECFDARLCLNFFPVFDQKFLVYDYVFDAVVCILFMILFSCEVYLLISTHSKNSIHLGLTVQKFKNLVHRLRGPPFWYPKILSNFISFFIMDYAENFMRLLSVVKSLNFSGTILGETPTLVAPNFGQIFHFLYICLPVSQTLHVSTFKG